MYIKISQDNETFPYSLRTLKKDHKNVSFPVPLTDEVLATFNVFPVQPVDAPTVDEFEIAEVGDPKLVDGQYVQQWTTTSKFKDFTDDEGVFSSQIDQENAHRQFLKDAAELELRSTRNRLLAETDYFALSDVNMNADMTTYRQALRDLPANTVDVFNPVYPTKP